MHPRSPYPGRPARVAVLTSLLVFAGCNALQLGEPLRLGPGDWTTAGGNEARTNTVAATLTPPLERAWRYDADAAFGGAAATAADGVIVLATRQGELHAIDVETGKKRGVGDLKHPIIGAPVLTSRVLYAPVAEGKRTLIAYDFDRGTRLWALRTAPIEAGLLLAGELLVAADLDGIVHGVERSTGAVDWTLVPDSAAGFFAAPVQLGSGRIAVADDRGRVTALDVATGQAAWTHLLDLPVYETPAASSEHLFVPTTRGTLAALDLESGDAAWVFSAETGTVRFSAPAVAEDRLVVGSSDGIVRALALGTGEVLWSFQSDGNFASAPLVTEGVVYVGAQDESLYALDLATGDMVWQTTLDGRIKSEPVLHRGVLVVLAEPKFVYGFTAAPLTPSPEVLP